MGNRAAMLPALILAALLLLNSFLTIRVQAITDSPQPGVETEAICSLDQGGFCSLVLGTDGKPRVAFYDATDADLKYAFRNDTGWTVEIVDHEGNVGMWLDLALDASDRPHISYSAQDDPSHFYLKYATWNGSTWITQTVDQDFGRFSSIALDSNGNPHISYSRWSSLNYASWNGSEWKIETINLRGGSYTSLALDSNDRPFISYEDLLDDSLKLANWNGSAWGVQTVDSYGSVGNLDSSLVLDANNYPRIAYCGDNFGTIGLRYAAWNGSSWNTQTVESKIVPDFSLASPSLALDSGGKPHISYFNRYGNFLKYAVQDASSWLLYNLSAQFHGGYSSSLALDSGGAIHICYDDSTDQLMKHVTFTKASIETPINSWKANGPMKEARASCGVAAVGGKIYVFGGDQGSPTGCAVPEDVASYQTVNFTEEYDPASDTWSFKKPMPTARARLGVAVYKNKVYCLGGYYGKSVYDEKNNWSVKYINTGANEVYDPSTDTWETRTPMPTFEGCASASVVNGKIFVLGIESLQVYDPETDSWEARVSPPRWISSFTSAVIDDKIYTLAELKSDYEWPFAENIVVYDTKKDYWMVGSESPFQSHFESIPLSATTGAFAAKLVYFFDDSGTHVYNPRNDSWTVGEPMPSPRLLVGITTIDDIFYVIGGRSGQLGHITILEPSAVNERYVPFDYGTPDPAPIVLSLPRLNDTTPPDIGVLSPVNITYTAKPGYNLEIPLTYSTNEDLSWIGYSLNGASNITLAANGTLIELPAGNWTLMLFANDTAGNMGSSETMSFAVEVPPLEEPSPSPTSLMPVATVVVGAALAVAAGLLLYNRKRRREAART